MNQKTRQDIKKRVTKKRNREVGINIRLLPEEKKHITELAKACKLSVSEMFRQIMRGQKLHSIPSDAYTDILFLFTALDEYIEHEEMESFFDQLQEAVHEFRETVENFYRGVNGDDKNMDN